MKKSLAKLTFALALAAVAFLGTAKPSYALFCGQRPGCSFVGVEDYGSAICCTYICNGQTRIGLCAVN
jgi:hypothetical protein